MPRLSTTAASVNGAAAGPSHPASVQCTSLDKWDDYTRAKEEQFRYTDTDESPWITIKSNDKKRGRDQIGD